MPRVYEDLRARRRGGVRKWVIDYWDHAGKRHRELTTAVNKDQAKAVLRKRLDEVMKAEILGVPSPNALRKMPFDEFLNGEYLDHCKATHTETTWKVDQYTARMLVKRFGKATLRSLTTGDVQKFVDQSMLSITRTGRRIRPGTVNKRFVFLSGVMSEAVRRGYIERNPVTGIKQLKEYNDTYRFLSEAEEKRIMTCLPDHLGPIVTTAIHTGMRLGELRKLTWSDLDFDRRLLRVAHAKNGKTRHIPMNNLVVKALRCVLPFTGPEGPSPHVFTNPETGKPYTTWTHSVQTAGKHAGVLGFTFHTFRHTFASRLAQAGAPLLTIKELLGHGSMQMVLRYAHLCPNNHRSAVDLLTKPLSFPAVTG